MKSFRLVLPVVVAVAVLAAAGDTAEAKTRAEIAAERKVEIEKKKAAIAEKQAAARKAAEEKAAARKAAREEKKADAQEKAAEKGANYTDKRQSNQEKRISHGIKKGYLTDAEVKSLKAQQDSIAALESTALADGKMTRDEFKSLRTALNEASACIWAGKHDTEGSQMAAYRFGKNVFAKDSLTSSIESGSMSSDEAKAVMKEFRRMSELKAKLSAGDLGDADRAALQAEYDDLLNEYFEVR